MRRLVFPVAGAMVAAAFLAGCSSAPAPPSAILRGPHDGTAFVLPGAKGIVEIVNEPEVVDRRGNVSTSVVAYFLQADGRSALDPAPMDVKFEIRPGARKLARVVPLAAAPKAGDPAGAARFASQPGPYDLEATHGALSAAIGGVPVSVAVGGGR